jgi:alkanesulfonate monooxygenase SsuD/methylene tetrahydromethanopterin reductase-like flavin-dependent oxidoreductase (luciferase family)
VRHESAGCGHRIANVFVRDAWVANAAAKTLAEAYPDRFVLGLGVSHRPLVEMRGHDYRSPLSTMRAYLEDSLHDLLGAIEAFGVGVPYMADEVRGSTVALSVCGYLLLVS